MPVASKRGEARLLPDANQVFSVSFVVETKMTGDARRKYTEEQFKDELKQLQSDLSLQFAERAQRVMGRWLSERGGKYDLGTTGTAGKNLMIGSQIEGGVTQYFVYEGDLTEANKYIRTGTRAKPNKSDSALFNSIVKANKVRNARAQGKSPKRAALYRHNNPWMRNLEAWAKAKGLRPKVTQGSGRSKGWQSKNRRVAWRSMMWALWHTMMRKGTSVSLERRIGTKNFDYPYVYVRSRGLRSAAERIMDTRNGEVEESLKEISGNFVRSVFDLRRGGALTQRFGSNVIGSGWLL